MSRHPESADESPTIDHEFQDNVVCPYCGHKHDPTDFCRELDYEYHDCDGCKKRFRVDADYTTTYTTTKTMKTRKAWCQE